MNFTDIVRSSFDAKRYRIKSTVYVPALYERDSLGRFAGGLRRKAYSYHTLDRAAPMVTGRQLLSENIRMNNQLWTRLNDRAVSKEA